MGQIPEVGEKPKYNNDDKFTWVDSQWEKFLTEQRELKATIFEKDKVIEQLQEDLITCNKHFQIQRAEMMDLISRVPSKYLTGGKDE